MRCSRLNLIKSITLSYLTANKEQNFNYWSISRSRCISFPWSIFCKLYHFDTDSKKWSVRGWMEESQVSRGSSIDTSTSKVSLPLRVLSGQIRSNAVPLETVRWRLTSHSWVIARHGRVINNSLILRLISSHGRRRTRTTARFRETFSCTAVNHPPRILR